MSALPPKADILGRHEKGPLMTQSGHSGNLDVSIHALLFKGVNDVFKKHRKKPIA